MQNLGAGPTWAVVLWCHHSPVATGALVGLVPQTQLQAPPNWNMKHCKLVEFLSNLNVKAPRTNVKPPIDNFLATVLRHRHDWNQFFCSFHDVICRYNEQTLWLKLFWILGCNTNLLSPWSTLQRFQFKSYAKKIPWISGILYFPGVWP